jgi:nucleoside-diphosphate-sugar epimerase
MSTNKKHVLVTGGAGFIGSHLVERLLRDGKSVVVVDDLSTGSLENLPGVANHPKLRTITGRISACPELPQIVAQAESIYHLAAAVGVELVVKSPIHVLETNLHETEVLLKAAAPPRVPVLVASTSEVYGKSQKAAFSEEDDLLIGPPHQARWGYACSKLMDEFLALAYAKERALPVVIARLFNTVGPRQTGECGMVLPGSSRRPGAINRSVCMVTAYKPVASALSSTPSKRWCACKTAPRRAVKFLMLVAPRKSAFATSRSGSSKRSAQNRRLNPCLTRKLTRRDSTTCAAANPWLINWQA